MCYLIWNGRNFIDSQPGTPIHSLADEQVNLLSDILEKFTRNCFFFRCVCISYILVITRFFSGKVFIYFVWKHVTKRYNPVEGGELRREVSLSLKWISRASSFKKNDKRLKAVIKFEFERQPTIMQNKYKKKT